MPFTLAHPAIVVPLAKKFPLHLSMTGLVVGSMSPDFEYLLRMRLYGEFSHTLWGVFGFCLPISLLVCYIFHYFIKTELIVNLPYFMQQRLLCSYSFKWHDYMLKHYGIVLVSVFIGACSHIAWDAFTHENGYLLTLFQLEHTRLFHVPLYKLLQHVSSVCGCLVLLHYIAALPKQNSESLPSTNSKFYYWLCFGLLFCIFMSVRIFINTDILKIGHLVVNMMTGSFIAFILAGIATRFCKSTVLE